MSRTDDKLIKRPHRAESWTEHQISEIARCLNPLTGPVHYLSNYFYIQHPVRGQVLYQPYDYQRRLLDVYHRYRYSISMLPRQSGKCVTGDTRVRVKHSITGKCYQIPLGEFHSYLAGQITDITQYEESTGDPIT